MSDFERGVKAAGDLFREHLRAQIEVWRGTGVYPEIPLDKVIHDLPHLLLQALTPPPPEPQPGPRLAKGAKVTYGDVGVTEEEVRGLGAALDEIGSWRCSECGELSDLESKGSWRWTGTAMEHHCDGRAPQAGHAEAKRVKGICTAAECKSEPQPGPCPDCGKSADACEVWAAVSQTTLEPPPAPRPAVDVASRLRELLANEEPQCGCCGCSEHDEMWGRALDELEALRAVKEAAVAWMNARVDDRDSDERLIAALRKVQR